MNVSVIGVPTDYGVNRRGVDMGPSAVRYAGLVEELESLGANVTDRGDMDARVSCTIECDDTSMFKEIRDVTGTVADIVEGSARDSVPLVVGGDHSVSIGAVKGSSRNSDTGVLWLDAHGDFNTPSTSPSGNVHGMALAASLGYGEFSDEDWARASVKPSNVAAVGTRSLDDDERENLRDSELSVYTMSEIDSRGIADVTADALDRIDADSLHVSLDMDWLTPDEAPGVGTPVRGGVTYREAHLAMECIAESSEVSSADIVEVNPILDSSNRTAELSVELAASLFGKTVF